MEKVFLNVLRFSKDFPELGITIGMGLVNPIREGWVVKLREHQNFEGQDGMFEAFEIASETTQTVSGYKDGKTELWDVVEIYDNEEDATKAGRENGQMTIYQIETGELKWID